MSFREDAPPRLSGRRAHKWLFTPIDCSVLWTRRPDALRAAFAMLPDYCFRRDGTDEVNESLLERVNASGEAYLSHTRLNDRYVLRLAVGDARTTEADVRRAWDALRAAARA